MKTLLKIGLLFASIIFLLSHAYRPVAFIFAKQVNVNLESAHLGLGKGGYRGIGQSALIAEIRFKYYLNGQAFYGTCFSPTGNESKDSFSFKNNYTNLENKLSVKNTQVIGWYSEALDEVCVYNMWLGPWTLIGIFILLTFSALAFSPASPLNVRTTTKPKESS
jgi:hypothetical protein